MRNNGDYQFTLLPLDDIDKLQKDWVKVESESENSFFLSWLWIGTWIETFRPILKVLRVYSGSELVAIAAFTLNKQKRYRCLNSRTLHLHQTGDSDKDQIWIEYNGILAKAEHQEAATTSYLRRHLMNGMN